MYKTLVFLVILLLVTLLWGACAPESEPAAVEETEPNESAPAQTVPTPAQFEVQSLAIVPSEVITGDSAAITAVVKNSGGSEGIYTAALTVDGDIIETKEVTIAPSSSEEITFSLTEDTPGTYEIGVGGVTTDLVVKGIVLSYDDGIADDSTAIGRDLGTGHITEFTPSVTPFSIIKIEIFGNLYGSSQVYESSEFTVEIWDEGKEIIWTVSYPHTAKFALDPQWITIEVPDVSVDGDFYVHVFTCSRPDGGITIGYDSSIPNEHSNMTEKWEIRWWSTGQTPQSACNWMIRVIGSGS